MVSIEVLVSSPITEQMYSNYYLVPSCGQTSFISAINDADWETRTLSMWEQIRPFWQTTRDLMLAGF